jgi:hypothetical protein
MVTLSLFVEAMKSTHKTAWGNIARVTAMTPQANNNLVNKNQNLDLVPFSTRSDTFRARAFQYITEDYSDGEKYSSNKN